MKKILFCICLLLFVIKMNSQFTTLHNFTTAGGYSSLTHVNGILYGTTNSGGANDSGYVYSINTDGSGFTILHSFIGGAYNFPCGALLHDNGVLYGMTSQSPGTIYKLNIDGTGYTILHTFTYHNPDDGYNPQGSLIISGNVLYGMTRRGGAVYTDLLGGEGTIFKINTDGSNFALLHSFNLGEENPYGSLLLDGNNPLGEIK